MVLSCHGRAGVKGAREIELQNPKTPSPQLTTKVAEMAAKAAKLKMRPMTKGEEASIQHTIN